MNATPADQDRPGAGRSLPLRARGARPLFFDDDGATDAVVAIVTALAGEVWALRERIDSLESVLARAGLIESGAVDRHVPDDAERDGRSAEATAFTARVFRVFEEMRDEVVAGDTTERYQSLVERAYGEIGAR